MFKNASATMQSLTSINQTQEIEEGDLLDLDNTVIEEVNPNNEEALQNEDEEMIIRPAQEQLNDDENLMFKEENYSRADSFSQEFDKHAGADMNMITNYEVFQMMRKDEEEQ